MDKATSLAAQAPEAAEPDAVSVHCAKLPLAASTVLEEALAVVLEATRATAVVDMVDLADKEVTVEAMATVAALYRLPSMNLAFTENWRKISIWKSNCSRILDKVQVCIIIF